MLTTRVRMKEAAGIQLHYIIFIVPSYRQDVRGS